jgi:hypothetical protein
LVVGDAVGDLVGFFVGALVEAVGLGVGFLAFLEAVGDAVGVRAAVGTWNAAVRGILNLALAAWFVGTSFLWGRTVMMFLLSCLSPLIFLSRRTEPKTLMPLHWKMKAKSNTEDCIFGYLCAS